MGKHSADDSGADTDTTVILHDVEPRADREDGERDDDKNVDYVTTDPNISHLSIIEPGLSEGYIRSCYMCTHLLTIFVCAEYLCVDSHI